MTGERSLGAPPWSSRGNLKKCYAVSWADLIHAPKGSRSFTGPVCQQAVLLAFPCCELSRQDRYCAAFKILVNRPISIIK
jgi:hypothetical protein